MKYLIFLLFLTLPVWAEDPEDPQHKTIQRYEEVIEQKKTILQHASARYQLKLFAEDRRISELSPEHRRLELLNLVMELQSNLRLLEQGIESVSIHQRVEWTLDLFETQSELLATIKEQMRSLNKSRLDAQKNASNVWYEKLAARSLSLTTIVGGFSFAASDPLTLIPSLVSLKGLLTWNRNVNARQLEAKNRLQEARKNQAAIEEEYTQERKRYATVYEYLPQLTYFSPISQELKTTAPEKWMPTIRKFLEQTGYQPLPAAKKYELPKDCAKHFSSEGAN